MKTIILLIVLAASCSAFAQDALAELLGEKYQIASKIDESANSGDYGSIYQNLSDEYQSVVALETFQRICREGDWEVHDLRIGTITEMGDWAYAAVSARSIYKRKEKIIFDTLFFEVDDGAWKLMNFPFLPAEIPSLPRSTELRYK